MKKAEESESAELSKLREENALLRKLLETAPDAKRAEELIADMARFPQENPNPILRLSPGGRVLHGNEVGLSLIHEQGKPIGTILQSSLTMAVESGARAAVETSIGGRIYLFDVVPIPARGYVNVYGRDITQLREAEQALRQSESFFRQILESIPGMVFTTRPDGYCDYQSQQWVEYTGVPMSDHLGDGWNSLLHPEDRARALAAWQAAVKETAPYELEYRVRRHDGEYEWFRVIGRPIRDEQGLIVRWFGVLMNIEALERAKETLRQNEEKYRRLFESLPVGVGVENGRGDTLTMNPAGLRLHGFESREEMLTTLEQFTEVFELRYLDGRIMPEEEWPVSRALRGEFVQEYELCLRNRIRDCERIVSYSVEPVRDSRGQVTLLVYLMQDLTERKQMEDRLREAKEQSEAASRAKSEFLANMSHDIRTPITGILGMIELLQSRIHDGEQQTYLQMMRDSANVLLGIIGDILDLSRIEAGREEIASERFDLREELRRLIDQFTLSVREKTLEIGLSFEPQLPRELRGDREKLLRVLRNLVSNAVKYTDHGRIDVSVAAQPQGEHGVLLDCSVRDTGIGIPKERQSELFLSFSRLHGGPTARIAEGTGLGLAICRHLVTLLGGQIRVESDAGKGSLFAFSAPMERVEETEEQAAPGGDENPLSRLSPMRILLAEDNRVNRVFLEMMIRDAGHQIVSTANGRDAVEAAAERKFDLVLMDVQMPVMDGIEATAEIRRFVPENSATVPDVPIIALTAFAMKEDGDRLRAAGMNGYVTKPVDWTELARVIRESGRY